MAHLEFTLTMIKHTPENLGLQGIHLKTVYLHQCDHIVDAFRYSFMENQGSIRCTETTYLSVISIQMRTHHALDQICRVQKEQDRP